jgi:nicotinate-nucleotide adenylyltransferase
MRRVALLGGSFNPPHIAHQMACLFPLSAGLADEVWVVPCRQHPFHKELVGFEHRFAMCSLACGVFAPGSVSVSRVEEELGGESRTLYTLEHLGRVHPEHRFSLVIGADILREKEAWYRFDLIEKLADLIVIGRSGYASPEGSPVLPPVSSTEIRERLSKGLDVSAMVPARVLAYIRDHDLYPGPRAA